MPPHTCHAHGCARVVPPRMFMCSGHWFSLPSPLRAAIWREYKPGQEITKNPSQRYMAVQKLCVAMVAFRPNDEHAARAAAPYLFDAEVWQEAAIRAGQGDPFKGLLDERTATIGEEIRNIVVS